MFLRKLLAALAPLLLCAFLCFLFPLISAWGFLGFVLMGFMLGAALALVPVLLGAGRRRDAFGGMLVIPAVLLFCLLLYQYLTAMGMMNVPALAFLYTTSSQSVLVESVFFGFITVTLLRTRK